MVSNSRLIVQQNVRYGVPKCIRAVKDAFIVSERPHFNASGGRSRPPPPPHFRRPKASAFRMNFSRISQAPMAICAPAHAMLVLMRRSASSNWASAASRAWRASLSSSYTRSSAPPALPLGLSVTSQPP